MTYDAIRVMILTDNKGAFPFIPEHGFSLSIEAHGHQIIFDTGAGMLSHNADSAAIMLSDYDTLILSHGHNDHTGGIPSVISAHGAISAYAHADIAVNHYSKKSGTVKTITIPEESLLSLFSLPTRNLHLISSPVRITETIGLVCAVPRIHPCENELGYLYADHDCTEPDAINDELTLWIMTSKGLTVFTGCCHAGVMNTCDYIMHITGENRIDTLIGGLHLKTASPMRIRKTCDYINRTITHAIPCHCTGHTALTAMINACPNHH